MGKLHELLAVEPDLKGAAEKIQSEAVVTFTKKIGHFQGQVRTYQPLDDQGESFPQERKEMVTNVQDKLGHVQKLVVKYLDAVAQKECTNTEAKAILEVDGKALFENALPATLLLALEGKLKQLRSVYQSIPTLDPGQDWEWDASSRSFKAAPQFRHRTKKVMKNHVKAPATDKHPAQVEVYTEDVRVGTWTERGESGMLTPAQKSDLLERIDVLAQAVKRARQRANDKEVKVQDVGETIFSFIHQPLNR